MISDFIAALITFSLRKLGVAPSTISREVRRNRLPNMVPHLAAPSWRKKGRIPQDIRIAVEFMLELDCSPEQIAAICKRIGLFVSHEWIYGHVLADFQ